MQPLMINTTWTQEKLFMIEKKWKYHLKKKLNLMIIKETIFILKNLDIIF